MAREFVAPNQVAASFSHFVTRGVFLTTTLRSFSLSLSSPSIFLFPVSGPHFRSVRPVFFLSTRIKMGIGNIPFPSFTLLLTSDRVVIPGPSYVFRFARLPTPHSQACRETAIMPKVIRILSAYYRFLTNHSKIKPDWQPD